MYGNYYQIALFGIYIKENGAMKKKIVKFQSDFQQELKKLIFTHEDPMQCLFST